MKYWKAFQTAALMVQLFIALLIAFERERVTHLLRLPPVIAPLLAWSR